MFPYIVTLSSLPLFYLPPKSPFLEEVIKKGHHSLTYIDLFFILYSNQNQATNRSSGYNRYDLDGRCQSRQVCSFILSACSLVLIKRKYIGSHGTLCDFRYVDHQVLL
jgi:hypothetical protein